MIETAFQPSIIDATHDSTIESGAEVPAGFSKVNALRAPRESLYSFQQRLSQRIEAAQNTSQIEQVHLFARIGSHTVLVPLLDTHELMAVPVINPVVLTQDWVLGLAVVRSEVVSVFDLSRFLSGSETRLAFTQGQFSAESVGKRRMVLLSNQIAPQTAFLVDEVLGMVNLQQPSLHQLQKTSVAGFQGEALKDLSNGTQNETLAEMSVVCQFWLDSQRHVIQELNLSVLNQLPTFLNVLR